MREVGDLYLTALLRLRGHVPSRVSSNGRRTSWVFEESTALRADLSGYFDGTLTVPAQAYAEALRSVKTEALSRSGAVS